MNAILLPGGGATLEPGYGYYDVSAKLLQLAMDANDRGDFFPVSAPLGPAARSQSVLAERKPIWEC